MKNKKNLINQIIYRSSHRGTKEMDIILANFVNKYINVFNANELVELNKILNYEDEILYKCYFDKSNTKSFEKNKIIRMLKEFKF